MIKEYIDRGEAILELLLDGCSAKNVESIMNIHAADVVPVVRCKDCKFWDCGDCYRLELSRPDDFCSYGEMRDNNG